MGDACQYTSIRLHLQGIFAALLAGPKKGPGLICRNGPEGASHKLNLVPFSAGLLIASRRAAKVFERLYDLVL